MANVFDVAKYILDTTGGSISTMKLQKLCYYSQAWHLVWNSEESLFAEPIQAWKNGPVCKELFEIHKGEFSINSSEILDEKLNNNLTEKEILTIEKIKGYYGEKTAGWLSELSHKELPWKKTREDAGVLPGQHCDIAIDNDLMYNYYSEL